MEGRLERYAAAEPPIDIVAPANQHLAVVLASPHSGADYPPDLLAASRLDAHSLRRSEDSFVDEIFAAGPALGAPLLRARFARAYLDPNREPFELDPAMFEDPLPDYVNIRSPRVQVGLGTIARIVATGEDIYAGKLRFADALLRVDQLYKPYHRALRQLVDTTRQRFGYYLLIDCHSMPSSGGASAADARASISCSATATARPAIRIIASGDRFIAAKGYTVARNAPYAGGFTTHHYGRPREGAHTLQIEINRGLYMDEQTLRRKPFLEQLASDKRELIGALGSIDHRLLSVAA